MTNEMGLVMLSAMYENGGNLTHRLLDGHPELLVYPFESQLGTHLVRDALTSVFPVKYRWPVFALDATAAEDFDAMIDEELKVRLRTPSVSKFRDASLRLEEDDRRRRFIAHVEAGGRSRGGNVMAFFRATFEAWRDYRHGEAARYFVGYSPIIIVDAEAILTDLPNATLVHVVRNPWSAYADTKKRAVPLSLRAYMLGWTLNQYHALYFQRRFPLRVNVLRLEDIVARPRSTLAGICAQLGLEASATLDRPSWNGTPLDEVYPWGTLRHASAEANQAAAAELSEAEQGEIRELAWQYLDVFDYRGFLTRS